MRGQAIVPGAAVSSAAASSSTLAEVLRTHLNPRKPERRSPTEHLPEKEDPMKSTQQAARVAMAALAAMATVLAFAPSVTAYVTTDQLDYAPGSLVTFSGDNSDEAGYLTDETVVVEVSGPSGFTAYCEGLTDFNGAWSCQITLPTEDAVGDYAYTATGLLSGVSESGLFTDATLTLYEDAAHTIQRNAFAYGEQIFGRGSEPSAAPSFVGRCFRIQWIDPASNVVDEDFGLGVGSPGPPAIFDADFTVPATGPSGVWTAILQRSSAVANCDNPATVYSAVGQSIQIFDVARTVIVGAGTTGADDPGGDNWVDENAAGTVQGPGGTGARLQVLSRATFTGLNRRTFVQFDVAGAGIPAAASVTDAKVRLQNTKLDCNRTYELQTAGDTTPDWSEVAITWNNQPGPVGTAVSFPATVAADAGKYWRFGVSDEVEDFLDGSLLNRGWRLKDSVEGITSPGVGCGAEFFATESDAAKKSQWPVLLVDWELGPLVTNSGLCTFDVNPDRDGDQFRLIYTPDQPHSAPTAPRWKLNASNPGQFYWNVFVTGTPDTEETITLTIPYPFVTKGANPVHVFDGVTIDSGDETCLTPGNAIEAVASPATVGLGDYESDTIDIEVTVTIPASGFVYIAVHLDYGFKHVLSSCYPDSKTTLNVTCELPAGTLINNHDSYTFSFSNGQSGSATVENENVVKNDPGIAGLVTQAVSNDPVAGAKVEIYNGSGSKVATVYTDADGWYQWTYKHTGKAATFVVRLPAYSLQQSVTLKSNAYVIVNFSVP
jgi:hypothetical protein